jgi:serine/threonine protein kinase
MMIGFYAGSYLYCAPENIRHQRYGTAVDVYSLGVLTNELCTLETPYEEKHLLPSDAAVGAADKQMRPQLPAKGSMHGGVIALVEAMWRQDPGERPPASEVAHKLEHFVQQVSQSEEQEKQQPPLERLRTLFKSAGG